MKNLFLAILALITLPGVALAENLKIASWNMNWLTDHKYNSRNDTEYTAIEKISQKVDADIFALQEIDASHAAIVFPPEIWNIHVSNQIGNLLTGFAVKKGIQFETEIDWQMRVNDRRYRNGAVITVWLNGEKLQLVSLHMKSGCFQTSDFSSKKEKTRKSCNVLLEQMNHLEEWMDAKTENNEAVILLGDFNHRLGKIQNDLWNNFNDGIPANYHLVADKRKQKCFGGWYADPIDHIILNEPAANMFNNTHFEEHPVNNFQKPASRVEKIRIGVSLTDHCPISLNLEL